MFWKNWSWSARILSVCGVGLIAAILFPVFARSREYDGHRPSCRSNLRQIGLALIQYEQDYDENFPPIITGGSAYGWADAIQPYLKSTSIYHCPSLKAQQQQNPLQNGYIDYPFNANLDRKSAQSITAPGSQILSLDGNDGLEVTNARYCLTQIPALWREDENSPLYRHLKIANYLFADGHVKALRPSLLSTDKSLVF